jgi:hypothetical protein
MKNLVAAFIACVLITSCENQDPGITEAVRIDNKLKALDKKLKPLMSDNQLLGEDRDSLVRTLFNLVKKDKDFVGFYMNTAGFVYCTENVLDWQINGGGDEPFKNPALSKTMWLGDVYHSSVRSDPHITSVGTGTQSNYQKVTTDVMYVHYEIQFLTCEIFLFYKLSKHYPDKFREGTYSTAGTCFLDDEFIVLK